MSPSSLYSYQSGLTYFHDPKLGTLNQTPARKRSGCIQQESEITRLLRSSDHEGNRDSVLRLDSCFAPIRRFWMHRQAIGLFESGKRLHKGFKFDEALEQYKESLRIYQNFEFDEVKIGELYYNMGRVYKDQTQLNDALSLFRNALEIFELCVPNSMHVAEAHCEIGSLYEAQARSGSAIEQYEVSIRIYDSLLETQSCCSPTPYPNTESAIYAYCKMGEKRRRSGQINVALVYFQKSVSLLTRYPCSLILSDVYYIIAKIYQSQDKIDDAISYYKESKFILQGLIPIKRLGQTDNTFYNPGINELTQSILTSHQANTAERATSLCKRATRALNLHKAAALFKQAVELSSRDLKNEALQKYEESLAIFEKCSPFDLRVADVRKNIGLLYQSQKKLQEALKHFEKTLELQRRLIPISFDIVDTYLKIGSIYKDQGKMKDYHNEINKAEKIKERCEKYGSCR